jgi:glycosyltransferase involved in cell wall biosynthesis
MMTALSYSVVLAVAYLTIVASITIVAALRAGGRRRDGGDDYEALAASRFTIPVSIIVPIVKASHGIDRSVSALLGLNYPELEVIVVADDVSQDALAEFREVWQLEAREFFYRKTIETSEVRRIYRSGRDGRLMVIDKAAGGYSDALNCGINVARYRYVLSVGPDITFDRDALLRAMASAFRDPASVVGASHHVERREDTDATAPRGVMALLQRLASVRTLMDSRLAWRHLSAGLGPATAVMIWRRDAVIKLKGFSATAADSDLDLMFRLQAQGLDGRERVDRGAEIFGHTAPQAFADVLRLAARRQRAALDILVAAVRGRAGALETRTLAYFMATELVTPLAQVWVVGAALVGALGGWFPWTPVMFAILLLSFGNAAVSAAALLLRGSTPGAPELPELKRLLAVGPLEFVLHSPLVAAARIVAGISYFVPFA